MKRMLSIFLSVTMIFTTCFALGSGAGVAAEKTALDYFKAPDYTAKPMARMWFPDASAGLDNNDTIGKQIQSLANAGFGGVEVAMLADSTEYTNEQAATFGWGTENWVKVLKKVYKAAAKVKGGFVVDMTITAHWPPNVNTFDPNDPEASKETSIEFVKVTSGAISDNKIELKLPKTKTTEGIGAPFIFTDTLVSAALAKVTAVEEKSSGGGGGFPGGPSTPATTYNAITVDYETLIPLDTSTSTNTPAGVPDKAFFEANQAAYGWSGTYDSAVVSVLGPDPTGTFADAADKIDSNGDRKRLADTQYVYDADLSTLETDVENAINGGDNTDAIKVNDYVAIGIYYRGTGQQGGTARLMKNRTYVPDYFDTSGIKAVTDYWDEHILSDAELKGLIQANPGSVFEDSIEASASTNFWTPDLMDKLLKKQGSGYAYKDFLPFAVSGVRTSTGFGSAASPDVLDFSGTDAEAIATRVYEDYNALLGDLYIDEHLIPENEWAAANGLTFRGQPYDLSGMDIGEAAAIVTIPEGDNMTKGDGLRRLSAANNLNDKKYLSMEAITGSPIYRFNWEEVLMELTANYSWGVNRAVLHGTAYSKAINGGVVAGGFTGSSKASWPGWDPFASMFGDPYTYRQIYWDKETTVTDYLSRIQALLQYTQQKIDVAVLQDHNAAFENPSGNSYQDLLDEGYSYNMLTDGMLEMNNAMKISSGVIYPDGPAYKAVVLDEVEAISIEAMNLLLAYADAGIPIILYDCVPGNAVAYGTDNGRDAQIRAKYTALAAKSNVRTVTDKNQIPALLKQMGVTGYARYDIPKLETTMSYDATDNTNYYYLFNNTSTFQGMLASGSAKGYKTPGSATYGETIAHPSVTLEGSGIPYILDPFTGSIRQAGQYKANGDGTVTVRLDDLSASGATIVALSGEKDFAKTGTVVTGVANGSDYSIVRDSSAKPVLRAKANGNYAVSLSTGKSVDVSVSGMPASVDLAQGGWNLILDSYGPKYNDAETLLDSNKIQMVDPSEHKITRVDLGTVPLVSWGGIQADASILTKLGVSKMDDVSGRGYYSTDFQWGDKAYGAELKLTYGNDQITDVKINGVSLAVDNITDTVDIGPYLKTGANRLEVELSSDLSHRVATVKAGYNVYGGGLGGSVPDEYLVNGLQGARLTPYLDKELEPSVAPPETPAQPGPSDQAKNPDPGATLSPISIAESIAVASKIADQAWTGKQIKPAVSISVSGKLLVADTDYQVSYGANKFIGQGSVTVTGKGAYTGAKTLTFKIVPKKNSIKKVTVGKKSAKVSFNKVSAAQKVTGYQVQYRQKGTSKWKVKAVSAKKNAVTIKGLKKGKQYQFRVRAYKTVAKVKYEAPWSAIKTGKKIK